MLIHLSINHLFLHSRQSFKVSDCWVLRVILTEYHTALVSSAPSSHSFNTVIWWLLEVYNLSVGDFCPLQHVLSFAPGFGHEINLIRSPTISNHLDWFHQEYLIALKVNDTFLQKDWQYKQFEVDTTLITASLKHFTGFSVFPRRLCLSGMLQQEAHRLPAQHLRVSEPWCKHTSTWSQTEEEVRCRQNVSFL